MWLEVTLYFLEMKQKQPACEMFMSIVLFCASREAETMAYSFSLLTM